MTVEEYRDRMIGAFQNADCSNLIALVVLPKEKEFEHLEWLLKTHYKDEQSEDCISREEAIRIAEQGQIQGYEWQFKELCNLPSVTPSYNSINTELKPCEDCVSREEAKKLIQGKIDDIPKNKDGTYGSMFGQYVNGLYCAKTAISYMSSVAPQTKRGKWIQTKDECEGVNFYDFSFECSKCGEEQSFKSNYCPNCGADMRESEGEK